MWWNLSGKVQNSNLNSIKPSNILSIFKYLSIYTSPESHEDSPILNIGLFITFVYSNQKKYIDPDFF